MTAPSLAVARPRFGTTLPFALPIGLSAFLLFSVEPLVGRLVLPVFGGTPAVWATTLCFFQVVLLAGYLYGHLSITRLGAWGPPLHLVLASAGLLALLIAPGRVADMRIDGVTPVLDLLRILFIVVGLPAFVLTTTTPLVSGWFDAARSRVDDPGSGDAYWLYALSNGGSLLALLAYPLLIEPRLGLTAQRGTWAVGYAALVMLIAYAASRAFPVIRARSAGSGDAISGAAPAGSTAARATAASLERIDWRRRGRWLLLAAVPSGLLSAVTTFIATDLVSAPLLWVIPLALYLASFIVAFSPRGGRAIALAVAAAPAAVTLLWVPYGSAGGWPVLLVLLMELASFAVIAVALHGLLAHDRPSSGHLTEFYLTLSVGGALASSFVALLAPLIFPGIWELPILLCVGLAGLALAAPRPAVRPRTTSRLDFSPFFAGARGRFLPYLVAAALVSLVLVGSHALATEAGIRWMLVGGLILLVGARPWFLAAATVFVLALATFVLQPAAAFRDRSFFGVTQVLTSPDGALTLLMNGTTVHGSQATDPVHRARPQAYYVQSGPAGDLFAMLDQRHPITSTVGVAGLGGGALAAYVTPGMAMTFFEIDPVVIQVASDPRYFTYLSDAPVRPRIVEGDARLSLAHEASGAFDLLVLDAFSSDSVPVHLLTVEAVQDEIRTLAPGGVIAFHISNRYYDLAPPIAAAVIPQGLTILEKWHSVGPTHEPGETPSHWLAASADPDTIATMRSDGWTAVVPADHPFTDDYADLIRYLQFGS
jgi:SAM-dependent methyltransferase